jgi:hypothetical protein
MRGQYEDLLVAEYWQGTSFPGTDNYERYIWADIHTGPNTFDFSQIETDMAAAAAVGKRFSMRIMMADYPYANAIPSWAQNVSGATITTSGSAGTAVYPNWNNPAYLSARPTATPNHRLMQFASWAKVWRSIREQPKSAIPRSHNGHAPYQGWYARICPQGQLA